jgi:hypothetical protein
VGDVFLRWAHIAEGLATWESLHSQNSAQERSIGASSPTTSSIPPINATQSSQHNSAITRHDARSLSTSHSLTLLIN